MRIIISAGLPRSGSTWLFNALRLLLVGPGLVSGWIGDVQDRSAEILLVKTHDPAPDLEAVAEKVFTCHRDIAEVAASLGRMNWPNDTEVLESIRRIHLHWSQSADLDIDYRDIMERPDVVVHRLAEELGVPYRDISTELAALQAPSGEGYDPVTLLHPGHRA